MRQREGMSDEQLAKRRRIERTSKRNARAKTKAQVRDLEQMVESLQATHSDERLGGAMHLLIQQQEQGRKLKSFLKDIHQLLADNEHLWAEVIAESGLDRQNEKLSHANRVCETSDIKLPHQESTPPTSLCLTAQLDCSLGQCIRDDAASQVAPHESTAVWSSVNTALERAVQHLRQNGQSNQYRRNMDIAIRVIADGWANVESMHSLDIDWLTLKEIDQKLFCDCSPLTRLAILHAMHGNMLVSSFESRVVHC